MGGKTDTGSDPLQPVIEWLRRSGSQTYGLTASKVLQRAELVEADRDSVAFRMERHTPLFEMHFPGAGMINFVTWRCTYVFDKAEKELQEKERKFVDVDIGDIDEALFSLFERIELDLESSPPVIRNVTSNYEEEVESEKELVEKVKDLLRGVDLTARLEGGISPRRRPNGSWSRSGRRWRLVWKISPERRGERRGVSPSLTSNLNSLQGRESPGKIGS